MTPAPVSSRRAIAVYLLVLTGSLFYCYNFNVVDYVRPYLIGDFGFSIADTANLGVAQNIGVTLGAFGWAALVVRFGYGRALVAITAAMGGAAVALALVTSFPAWFGLRGALAATLGGYYVVSTAVVVALFPVAWRGRLIALISATYPLSNILLGTLGAGFGDGGWHWLLWIAAAPLLLAPLAIPLVPRIVTPPPPNADTDGSGWHAMFAPRWRWRTLGCILLSGIDFNAYQLCAAFMTLFLKQEHGLGAAAIGWTVSLLSIGSLCGAFFWAWISDRIGRRWAALGYLTAAAAIVAMLFAGARGAMLDVIIFAFGFGFACNSAWGAWFAELFPERLRAHGAALFHGGHIVAMAAPAFVTLFTDRYGLVATMAVAAPVYLAGALLWFLLPETLSRRHRRH